MVPLLSEPLGMKQALCSASAPLGTQKLQVLARGFSTPMIGVSHVRTLSLQRRPWIMWFSPIEQNDAHNFMW